MVGFIVCGHGHFASGITSAVEMILGKQENYEFVDFPLGNTASELTKNCNDAIEKLEECDDIIVFCDLKGGSPFNTFFLKAINNEHIHIVYGLCLGMMVDSVMKRTEGGSAVVILSDLVATGKNNIEIVDKKSLKKEG